MSSKIKTTFECDLCGADEQVDGVGVPKDWWHSVDNEGEHYKHVCPDCVRCISLFYVGYDAKQHKPVPNTKGTIPASKKPKRIPIRVHSKHKHDS